MLNSFFYKYSLFNISCLWLYSSTNSDKELVDAFVDAVMNYDIKELKYPYNGIHCEYNTNVKNENAFYNKIIKLVSARNATLLDCAINDQTFDKASMFYLDNGKHDIRNFTFNIRDSQNGQKLYSTSMDILNKANLSQYTNVDDKYYAIFDWVNMILNTLILMNIL